MTLIAPPRANFDDEPDFEYEIGGLAQRLLTIPFCPWVPNAGPQERFLLDFSREVLYGGAVGGSKSVGLLMAASQFLDVPGYAALLLRKSYQQLSKPGALMDLGAQWWGAAKGAKYVASDKMWKFRCPGGGFSSVTFGYLERENDRFNYQGGQYQFIGYDELTHFKERDYTYLFSRLRRGSDAPLSQVPIRRRSTANPGGVGHEWVFRRFIAPWQAWQDGKAERPRAFFYPARLADNPKLDRVEYEKTLQDLDPVTRAQLLRGDWNIRPDGRMFKRSWFRLVNYDEIPGNCTWVRFWDMASTEEEPGKDPDYTVGALVGRAPDGRYFILDLRRWRIDPGQNEVRVRATAFNDSRRVQIVMEQEPGSSGKTVIHHYRNQVLDGFNFRGIPSTGTKIVRAGPVASQADGGNVYIVGTGDWDVEEFLSETEIFPDGTHDDQIDAVSGAMAVLARTHNLGIRFDDTNAAFEREPAWKPDRIKGEVSDAVNTSRGHNSARQAEERAQKDVRDAWFL